MGTVNKQSMGINDDKAQMPQSASSPKAGPTAGDVAVPGVPLPQGAATSSAKLDALSVSMDVCFKSCSDYSCVRMGSCTGCAGHDYSDELRRIERQREQDKADAALAAQINRLKKAGAI